jgi:hypothetical protein
MVTRRWMRVAAVGVAGAMLLVGCGDDGESAGSGQPATTAAPTSTTLSQVQLDKQKAQRIILTATDVPEFTMDSPDAGPDSGFLPGESCFNNDPLLLRIGRNDDPRGGLSPDVSDSDDGTVSSTATFAETDAEAVASLAALSGASFPACFARAFSEELDKQPDFTSVTSTATRLPAQAVGDQSIGYRVTSKTRYTGVAVTLYSDFVFVRSGRAVALIATMKATNPFPNSARIRLVNTVTERMAAP